MGGKVLSFALGFGFGVLSLTVFRREVNLARRIEAFALLSAVGLLLLAALRGWFRRIQQRASLQRGNDAAIIEGEWAGFLWGSISLWIAYLVLTFIVVFV